MFIDDVVNRCSYVVVIGHNRPYKKDNVLILQGIKPSMSDNIYYDDNATC